MSEEGDPRPVPFRSGRLVDRLRVPPSALPGGREERHASWLELFFDLAFALALTVVLGRLDDDPSPPNAEVVITVGLYGILWWSWGGHAFYDTRFDPDDLPHRLGVLLAMLGAGAMALGAREPVESRLLPIGYLAARGVLILLYLRVRTTTPAANQLTRVYHIGFTAGWLLWLASLAVPEQMRPVLWIAGFLVEFATPWVGRHWLLRFPVHPSHLPERIGQFTIILLGTTLVDLLNAVPRATSARMLVSTALAFAVIASIWWVYTTFVSTGMALRRLSAGLAYAYVHAVHGAALLFIGWALGQTLRQIATGSARMPEMLRLLLGGSLIIWMLCGLAMQLIYARRLDRVRFAIGCGGVTGLALLVGTIPDPRIVLPPLAALLVCYSVLVSRQIARISARLAR
ncbi:low temperature requirement protein A [Micromonospora sp. NPDC049559]|uniref:low temperature requirement protein A n=1 Tax=Micromonospora sp. NPDC049559 TaxID=3155923 RepID=UPI003418912E